MAAVSLMITAACAMPRLTDGSFETAPPVPRIELGSAVDAADGAPIVASDTTRELRLTEDDHAQPVAAWGTEIILRVDEAPAPGSAPTPAFATWNPETGERRPAWQGTPGTQEIVAGVEGDWAAVVRTGFALPFPEWTLMLRNLATGEVRTLAEGDPSLATVEGLEPGLPLGFAPLPSLHAGRVAWAQYTRVAEHIERQVILFDMATGQRSVVARATPSNGTLDSPALGGGRLAWIATGAEGEHSEFVIRDVAAGSERRYEVDGVPFLAVLSSDGRHLAWDDQMTAKYSYDLESGELTRFASDDGWGVFAQASRFTWAPAAAFGGTGGYFDTDTRETRRIGRRDGVTTNVATLLGDWFAWQEVEDGHSTYYFEPLGMGGTQR